MTSSSKSLCKLCTKKSCSNFFGISLCRKHFIDCSDSESKSCHFISSTDGKECSVKKPKVSIKGRQSGVYYSMCSKHRNVWGERCCDINPDLSSDDDN
jgi:hypothetical protein